MGIDAEIISGPAYNMELYFECDDFDLFMNKLNGMDHIHYVHAPKTYEWKQRVVRIFDPDMHIIEIGESMAMIAKRYLKAGYTVQDVSNLIQHPLDFVNRCKRELDAESAHLNHL